MWPVLARLANTLWWVWLLATLVVLGYFARQEIARGAARAHVGPGARWAAAGEKPPEPKRPGQYA